MSATRVALRTCGKYTHIGFSPNTRNSIPAAFPSCTLLPSATTMFEIYIVDFILQCHPFLAHDILQTTLVCMVSPSTCILKRQRVVVMFHVSDGSQGCSFLFFTCCPSVSDLGGCYCDDGQYTANRNNSSTYRAPENVILYYFV